MAFCTGCFAPSQSFLPYLAAYLTKCSGTKSSTRERKFALTCHRRLSKIASIGPRSRALSVSEIEAVKVLFLSFSNSVRVTNFDIRCIEKYLSLFICLLVEQSL